MEDIQNEKAYYRLQIGFGKALLGLKEGNAKFLKANKSEGDISLDIRKYTYTNGQKPFAVVISCSDSRVIPESIFSASIGDLFVIRVVGNVVDSTVLASMHYAVSHLNVPLVVVLGHTGCGAVNAAINDNANGLIKPTIDKIKLVIGNEKDDYIATSKNVMAGVEEIISALGEDYPKVNVVGAVYFADSGVVEFL